MLKDMHEILLLQTVLLQVRASLLPQQLPVNLVRLLKKLHVEGEWDALLLCATQMVALLLNSAEVQLVTAGVWTEMVRKLLTRAGDQKRREQTARLFHKMFLWSVQQPFRLAIALLWSVLLDGLKSCCWGLKEIVAKAITIVLKSL